MIVFLCYYTHMHLNENHIHLKIMNILRKSGWNVGFQQFNTKIFLHISHKPSVELDAYLQ